MAHRSLTRTAHAEVVRWVGTGDIAIDATAGNGHDTRFLSQLVGPAGIVFAIDIQAAALCRVAAILRGESIAGIEERLPDQIENVRLVLGDHSVLQKLIPAELHGRVAAVMMNLGYLPGGSREITTRSVGTLQAIEHGWTMLRSGGGLSVIAYTGHPGGREEYEAVQTHLAGLVRDGHASMQMIRGNDSEVSPVLFLVRRTDKSHGAVKAQNVLSKG